MTKPTPTVTAFQPGQTFYISRRDLADRKAIDLLLRAGARLQVVGR